MTKSNTKLMASFTLAILGSMAVIIQFALTEYFQMFVSYVILAICIGLLETIAIAKWLKKKVHKEDESGMVAYFFFMLALSVSLRISISRLISMLYSEISSIIDLVVPFVILYGTISSIHICFLNQNHKPIALIANKQRS